MEGPCWWGMIPTGTYGTKEQLSLGNFSVRLGFWSATALPNFDECQGWLDEMQPWKSGGAAWVVNRVANAAYLLAKMDEDGNFGKHFKQLSWIMGVSSLQAMTIACFHLHEPR